MATMTFRKVGGSVMATFPPIVLDFLNVKAGDSAEYLIEGDKIVIHPKTEETKKFPIRRYSLEKLIAEQKLIQKELDKDNDWVLEGPRGDEVL